jgi:hypothetical protein
VIRAGGWGWGGGVAERIRKETAVTFVITVRVLLAASEYNGTHLHRFI